MLFNSHVFIFLFFPLCMLGFYSCKRFFDKTGNDKVIKLFTLFMSLWFYSFLSTDNLPALLASMAVNYIIYILMEKAGNKKTLLITGLALNIGALFLFKYTGSSYVPLGISFFTFSQIAFLTECYRGTMKGISPLDYGVYVSFFPKLVQGPVMLPKEMLLQLQEAVRKKFDWEKIFRSLCLFVFGLSKKVLIADTFGKAADYGYANPAVLNSGDAVIVMLSYTLQLYFDFSGYCDMAMGIAGSLGFELPLNFDSPYKAGNIIEFWKGWHITLTRFFTQYLYIPLGGSRKGSARTCMNTLAVFLISGIWHGVGLTFIIWGMMHGLLYVVTRWWQEKRKNKVSSVPFTFLYVNIAWVFFRAASVKEALTLLKTMISCNFTKINWNLADCFNLDEFWYVIKVLHIDSWQYAHYILMVFLMLVALVIVFFAKNAVSVAGKMKPNVRNMVLLAVLFVWCVVSFSGVSTFLYFNF